MEYKKLCDIATVRAGGTPSRKNLSYWENGNIPWVKISDMHTDLILDTDEKITELGLSNSSAKLFKKGTILYSIFASLGEVSVLGIDATTNQAIAGIEILDESLICKEYLIYYLKSIKEKVISIGNGAAQNNINLGILKEFNIPIIDIKSQKKIAFTLKKIEEVLISKKEKMIKFDDLVKSRFIEMFEKRFSKIKIGEKFKTTSGGTPLKSRKDFYENGTIPWLLSGDVNDGIIKNVEHKITELGLKNSSAKMIPAYSVLVAMYGATAGKVALLTIEATTNQAVCSILPNKEYNPFYVYHALIHESSDIASKASGGAQPNISQGIIRNSFIYDAPLTIQNEFAEFVELIDKLKFICQQQIDELQELLDSKMDEYFG